VSTDFWQYWQFNVPNYLLAAVMYTLLGRWVLGMFVPPDWQNYIWRAFRALTDPVLRAVSWITPQAVPGLWLAPVAAIWVMTLRVVFALVMLSAGLAPSVPAAG
jgi:hypothetical protein